MINILCKLGLHNTPKDDRGYKSWHCERCKKLMIDFPKMIQDQKRDIRRLLTAQAKEPMSFTADDAVWSRNGQDVNYIKAGPVNPALQAAFRRLEELKDDMQSMR